MRSVLWVWRSAVGCSKSRARRARRPPRAPRRPAAASGGPTGSGGSVGGARRQRTRSSRQGSRGRRVRPAARRSPHRPRQRRRWVRRPSRAATKDKPACPTQAWMKANMAVAAASGDGPALAKGLDYIAAHAPAGMGNWSGDRQGRRGEGQGRRHRWRQSVVQVRATISTRPSTKPRCAIGRSDEPGQP